MLMNKMRKNAVITGTIMVVLLFVSACNKLDVVGASAKTSFGEVLAVMEDSIFSDADSGAWILSAPDGTAQFVWFSDFTDEGYGYEVLLYFYAVPFLEAGLDPAKLPAGYHLEPGGGIIIGADLGSGVPRAGEPTALTAFEQIVDLRRGVIGYHAALDHYGVTIGDGNLFEWAKDMSVNDKDIVFVLNPEPFIAAGVDPNLVAGWIFTKVPVDVDGRPTEVDKLIKPFDLR
jgi:hypothetical protein